MKISGISSLLFILLFALSCRDTGKMTQLQERNALLEAEYIRLSEEILKREQILEEYSSTLNEVYDYMERIRRREGLLMNFSLNTENIPEASVRENIWNNLSSIDSYLKISKQRLQRLKERMNADQLQFTSLEKTIEKLEQTLNNKEIQINGLKEEIRRLNQKIAESERQIQVQSEILAQQSEVIRTAYYIIGTENELREKGIIEEKGGILGIRKTKTLTGDFDESFFNITDIDTTDQIRINNDIKEIRIISAHPSDSYSLEPAEQNRTVLQIRNAEEFWRMKYLVILTRG